MSDRVTQDEFRAYMTSAGVGYRLAMRHFADRAPPLGTARRWGTTKPKGRASKGDAPYQSGHTPRKKPPPTPPTAGPVLWDPLESTCRHASLSIL